MQYKITDLKALQIYDSRSVPTVEVSLELNGKFWTRASVPSGASVGCSEAVELRDNQPDFYHGKGVETALHNIRSVIGPKILGRVFESQAKLDEYLIELDGSENKSNLGANSILPISMSFAGACAYANGKPLYAREDENYILPVPLLNLINGGAHADNNLVIQEFMIMPMGFETYREALRAGSEIFHSLKGILHRHKYTTAVGDEGGFAPNLENEKHALEMLTDAVQDAGYKPGEEVFLALDVAASNFYKDGKYWINNEGLSTQEFSSFLIDLVSQFPISSIEDPYAETDFEGWKIFSDKMKNKMQIVGDDLFVSSAKLLKKGIKENMANAILIKPNQVGTFTEMESTIKCASEHGYGTIISHRSGETEDFIIAHLALLYKMGQIKAGSLCRGERVIKYNELLRIEEELGDRATFYGEKLLKRFKA